MKNKIVWKLTAYFAAVLLLFTFVLGIIFLSKFRQHTIAINRSSMEEKAISIAKTLSSFNASGTQVMRRGGMGGYGAYLRFLDELAMAEVWIVDENLNMQTTGHGYSLDSSSDLPENAEQIVKQVFEGEVTYGQEFSGLLDTPSLTVGAPIYSGNRISGAVLLHSPVSGVDDAVRQGLSTLSAGIGVALILAGAAAVLFSYRFTNPLQRMKTAALRLADGQYDARTCVLQNDEIGQLAQTIDLLADHLTQALRERAALDKMKEDFLANVSHELRTPVAVLRGSLEVLLDGTVSEPEEIREYYEQMLLESQHQERLVNDLLDLSRLQDVHFRLEMSEMNLCDVVSDAVRAIRRVAQNKSISVPVTCPKEECVISGDYSRLRQLLLILLDNAVKFSEEKGCVELVLKRKESQYVLTVTNQGTEIPPEELPHIFERFQKMKSAQNPSGTGLGLAIAQQIAQRHGTVISAASRQGCTCFTIQFSGLH